MTSKAQIDQPKMSKGNSFTQLSSKSNAKDDAAAQPSDNQTSDVIVDVLRKVNGGTTAKTEQQLTEAPPAAAAANKTKPATEKKGEKKDGKQEAKAGAKAPADKNKKGQEKATETK